MRQPVKINQKKNPDKPDLSIIIPFAGEYPQVLFTIQAVAQSLLCTGVSFEILAVDNYCDELTKQWDTANVRAATAINKEIRKKIEDKKEMKGIGPEDFKIGFDLVPKCHQENKSGDAIKAAAGHNKWLRYFDFPGWLSHWECKRLACQEAKADTFLFLDAHTVPTAGIDKMFQAYEYFRTDGSFHMPLTYKILEWRRLIYKHVIENDFWGYSFTSFPSVHDSMDREPVEVPCMSTCGMMISREIYEAIGGWPKKMTAYGGGENFMNYALAVCGFKKWIFPPVTLFHHGEKRDYHYTFDGIVWNRLVSHYLFGGKEIAEKLALKQRGAERVIRTFLANIYAMEIYQTHRNIIKANTKIDLLKWRKQWEV